MFFLIGILYGFNAFALKLEPAARLPLQDFFRNPEVSDYAISPDAKNLAYLKPWENRMNLFVQPRIGGPEKRLTSIKDRDIRAFSWKGNDVLLYSRDFDGDENYHLYATGVKGEDEKDLTPWPDTRAEIVDDLEENSPDEILVAQNHRDPQVFDLSRVNVRTGKESLALENPGKLTKWITDHKGHVRLAIETNGNSQRVLYRDDEKQKFRAIKILNFKQSFTPYLFTYDDKHLYVASNIDRDKVSLVEYDPKTDREVRILYQHPEYDVEGIIVSKKKRAPAGTSIVTWKYSDIFFDPDMEQIHHLVESHIGDAEIHLISHDKAEEYYVVRSLKDRLPGAYYLYDVRNDEIRELGKINPLLSENQLAPMRPIQYASRDGLTIHGYLTMPKGVAPKNLPFVIFPHAGPWMRDVWRYSPDVQFFANRGYAVLQMNFRGSTGYGRRFWEASFKEWGLKMQDDITDGVNWVIEQGLANPKKIIIYGSGYGGYAALQGLTSTPNLYAGAVDDAGYSNLFTFLKTLPPYWKPFLTEFHEMVGDPEKDKDQLNAASPGLHADRIRAPLMITQGAKDLRVERAASDQMVEALKKRNNEVIYLVKDNEGHGFHNEENRFDYFETVEKFLDKQIGKH